MTLRAYYEEVAREPVPDRFMVHVAIQEVDEAGNPADWGEHVTDEEYGAR